MRKQDAPVLVVGGGLGGLTTGVTLGQQGVQVGVPSFSVQ